MNDCVKIKELLNRYFNDELDRKKRLYIEAHVKSCIMCCAEMEFAKKRVLISELLDRLKPEQSFIERISNAPNKLKQMFKRAFLKRPVLLPSLLVLIFLFIPFGIYLKKNISFRQIDEIKLAAQTAQEVEKPAAVQGIQQKTFSVNPIPSKEGKKVEKKEAKKQEIKETESKIEAKIEKIAKKLASTSAEKAKREENAEKNEAAASVKVELVSHPTLYRLTLKSDLQPDIIFTKIDSLSEDSGAVILYSKGFMPDSSGKKEIVVRMPKEKYESFLKNIKNQFTDVSSVIDKDIKLSNDISKQEGQSFILIEVN